MHKICRAILYLTDAPGPADAILACPYQQINQQCNILSIMLKWKIKK